MWYRTGGGGQMSSPTNVVAIGSTFLSTVIYFYVAKETLRAFTHNDELWALFFLSVFALITIFTVAYRHMYKPQREDQGEGYRSRLMALAFLQMTTLLLALQLLFGLFSHVLSITRLSLTDYYLLFSLCLTLVFVLLYKLQRLFE